MTRARAFYDELTRDVVQDTVTAVTQGYQWTRVATEKSLGVAYTMGPATRPEVSERAYQVGASLHAASQLATSWNLREAAFDAAAVNAHYADPQRAAANGFTRAGEGLAFPHVFRALAPAVAGKKVVVVGHFPFAPEVMSQAGQFAMLEVNPQQGDYPASACEFLLPEADVAIISGSALVNKTLPRLLELSQEAFTVVIGPSTPLAPMLFDHGVDFIAGLVTLDPNGMDKALGSIRFPEMMRNGYRADQFAPGRDWEQYRQALEGFQVAG
ncbi:Rossmann-like domain-containing protein [Corynebacterium atypicum]|uniref:Rossmann-like domain-containing protein n=1 Tax=Corynebacterium atypicum TaxID=191610 RepID=UPI00068A894A|nr:DUF364 domain-containing protein [Corynebacterium atypicum]